MTTHETTHGSAHPHHHPHDPASAEDPATHWEQRYAAVDAVWSGRVNATMAHHAVGLEPVGTALDLGSGEGGDAVWLAGNGWHVTAVDISPTALARGRAAAEALGADLAARIDWVAADLATWQPPTRYRLVTASFLHSTVALPRTDILRRAAGAVEPGGHLLVVSHAEPPPWAGPEHRHHVMTSPQEDLAELALDPAQWEVVRCETVERTATDPEGRPAVLRDGLILLRRR